MKWKLIWMIWIWMSIIIIAFDHSKKRISSSRKLYLSMRNQKFLEDLGKDISTKLGINYVPTGWKQGSEGGYSSVSTGIITDEVGKDFFVKSGGIGKYEMFAAEFDGIQEIYSTKTIRVPQPITRGTSDSIAYVVFEKLSIGGRSNPEVYAEKLVSMHKQLSPNGQFGWKRNNTIGYTFQPNNYCETWAEFWDQYRLGHMILLARAEGGVFTNEKELREKVKEILGKHECVPSLVHGDLWSGNQGATSEGEPVIYDPALYYGDREVDIAMTKLFGSNSKSFYDKYNQLWPLPPGWEIRETIYNLYHILNHYVLFGGSYLTESYRMIDRILKTKS